MADAFGPTLVGSLNFTGAILRSFYLRGRMWRWGREDLRSWQQSRLRWLVRWAYCKSAFYRELYDQARVNISDFELTDLPPVDKRMLMDNFDQVMTTPEVTRREVEKFCDDRRHSRVEYGHFKGKYLPVKSSGSSGERGLFVFDKAYFRRMFAAIAAHRLPGFMPKSLLNMSLAALFSPDEFHLATTAFPRLTPLGIKTVFISASADLRDIAEKLNEAQPDILCGFPSLIEALCGEAADGRLRINPSRICCTGESLPPRLREKAQRTLGCPVYNLYGCAEANPMAMQYGPEPHLKVIEDFVILEPVDAQLHPIPVGQASHGCLVTNLHSTVMPIIRYKLNDQIKFLDGQAQQESVFTLMEDIGGRRPVMIRMQDRGGREVLILPAVLVDLLAEDSEVRAVQVRQAKIGEIRILANLAGGAYQAGVKARLAQTVNEYLLSRGIAVENQVAQLEIVDRIPPDPISGKVHAFVCQQQD